MSTSSGLSDSKNVDVSVVVPTYNRAADLAELLECLARQQLRPDVSWEVVVVDNGSSDSTQLVLRQWLDRLPLRVAYEPVRGTSSATNRGIHVAQGSLLVFLDSDVQIGPKWLQSFVDAAEAYPDFTYFGGLVLNRYETSPPSWYIGIGQCSRDFTKLGGTIQPCTHLKGANWACRAEALASVGGFDTRFGPTDLPTKDWRLEGSEAHLMDRLMADGYQGLLLPSETNAVLHRVSNDEMRLMYVVRWHFGMGRGEAARWPVSCVRIFGLPRWRIRQGVTELLRLLGSLLVLNRRQAVGRLTEVASSIGYLYESTRSRL